VAFVSSAKAGRISLKNGLEKLDSHHIRPQALSRFCEKDLSLSEVAAISGHSHPGVRVRYAYQSSPGEQNAL